MHVLALKTTTQMVLCRKWHELLLNGIIWTTHHVRRKSCAVLLLGVVQVVLALVSVHQTFSQEDGS
jgi:hypothetical protein